MRKRGHLLTFLKRFRRQPTAITPPPTQDTFRKVSHYKQGELLVGTTVFVIVVVLFAVGMLAAVWKYSHGAAFWESFYAKEIARVVNSAEQGDEVVLDVHTATEIAQKNGVKGGALRSILRFDGARREIVVSLRATGATRFSYFNDVVIVEPRIEEERGRNVLKFRVERAVTGGET